MDDTPATALMNAGDDYVRIFDTTLRDGEQSPGISLNLQEKLEIAQQLSRLHVDVIEAGFPITSTGDFEAVHEISKSVRNATIAALARCARADIERAAEALEPSARSRIHVFISTSPIHMEKKLQLPPDKVLDKAVEGVRMAKGLCDEVEFSAEDSTRSDPGFLVEIFSRVVEAGATILNVPDTVGYTMPQEYEALLRHLFAHVRGIERCIVSAHCHDDLGLAVANSLAAVRAGARQVECAVNGIGERAGNCSLEEVVMALRTRRDLMGLESRVETREILRASRLVSSRTGFPVPPNKAIVGRNAFAHESGIHQDGVIKHRATYEIMDPRDIGDLTSALVLGKHSGRHALRKQIEALGYTLADEELDRIYARFKELTDRKFAVTGDDLAAIVADERRRGHRARFGLDHLEVHTASGKPPLARAVVHEHKAEGVPDETREGMAIGDGPVAAVLAAVAQGVGIPAKLVTYSVGAITGGSDALGEVTIQWEVDGRRVFGRAVSTDVVEASALAYIDAMCKLGEAPAAGATVSAADDANAPARAEGAGK
jgi:2-isopropylmalate synthase